MSLIVKFEHNSKLSRISIAALEQVNAGVEGTETLFGRIVALSLP